MDSRLNCGLSGVTDLLLLGGELDRETLLPALLPSLPSRSLSNALRFFSLIIPQNLLLHP